ncbi:hypothetical protein [Streptomyces acidicola]|uniref:hypothetical protein n=1 Tax=Streptomyces acidicola TaxID=2596892 RepID=UPI00188448BE|nr:hypothetical protein [Streptomyces acidicola]
MASPGYHQALAAHQAAWADRHVDPSIAAAIESHTRALREASRHAFPEPDPSDQPSRIETARAQRRRASNATHALAQRGARAERAQRDNTTADAPQSPACGERREPAETIPAGVGSTPRIRPGPRPR